MCGFRDGKKNPETIFPALFQKMRAPAVSLQPALLFFEDASAILPSDSDLCPAGVWYS